MVKSKQSKTPTTPINDDSQVKRRRSSRIANKSVTNSDSSKIDNGNHYHNEKLPSTPSVWQRGIKRVLLSFIILGMVYYSAKLKEGKESQVTLATSNEFLGGSPRGQEVKCPDTDYMVERKKFKGCAPTRCGRMVTDSLITESEARKLLALAKRAMSLGGGSGSATIFDLHSGALSMGEKFINVHKALEAMNDKGIKIFTADDFEVYRRVKNKIQQMIAMQFGLMPHMLFLTHPTFFSQLTSAPPNTIHDEYWHMHVDKEAYKSFHYTSLLYLSTYKTDFEGGRFTFAGNNSAIVEPKLGRVLAFTSASENPHFVEKVTNGIRFALTVSFTCDPDESISEPNLQNLRKPQ